MLLSIKKMQLNNSNRKNNGFKQKLNITDIFFAVITG